MPLNLRDLARANVVDTDEQTTTLGSLWRAQAGPTVMVWLRHYG